MNFVEFVGLIISVVALMVISARKAREERHRRQHPEEYQREQEEKEHEYRELLKTLDLPIPEELQPHPSKKKKEKQKTQAKRVKPAQASDGWKAPVTKRVVRSDYQFQSRIETWQQKTRIDNRRLKDAIAGRAARFRKNVGSENMQTDPLAYDAYALDNVEDVSRTTNILGKLKNPLQMIVFHEILSKPKGLQKMGPLQGLPWAD